MRDFVRPGRPDADAAFARAVSHTSLIAAIARGVGTVTVAALLPTQHQTTSASQSERD